MSSGNIIQYIQMHIYIYIYIIEWKGVEDVLHLPSVESTIVPSKSKRRPSKESICGGAEKVSCVVAMVGGVLGCGDSLE